MEEGSYREKSVEARMDREWNAVEGIEEQGSERGWINQGRKLQIGCGVSKEGISGGRNRSKVAGTEEGMMEDGRGRGYWRNAGEDDRRPGPPAFSSTEEFDGGSFI